MIQTQRAAASRKNDRLESLLRELNGLLGPAQAEVTRADARPKYPVLLVLGCPRSGTTLLMQWLAATGRFAYPSNFLSRFYEAPYVGARIQQMLTDPACRQGEELGAPDAEPTYASALGKTVGHWSPNEFWYFWRRFIPNDYPEFLDPDALSRVDSDGMLAELATLESVFDKPWAMKGLILQQNAAFLAEAMEPVVFLFVKRHPFFTMQSLLEARRKFFGDERHWYSVKPREFDQLESLDPFEQVAGQTYYVNRGIAQELERVDRSRYVEIDYEEFCRDPMALDRKLARLLENRGCRLHRPYEGPEHFESGNQLRLPCEARTRLVDAYEKLSGVDVSP